METAKLIMRVALGSKCAFEKLYNDCFKLVYSVAWSITQDKSDAEDVAMEVFISVWNKAGTFNGGNGKSWLMAIAKNLSLDHVRKNGRETELKEDVLFSASSVEKTAENKILIENALSKLSEKERETVLLFNAGLKHREIAEILGEKLGTITWRYNTALKKMKTFLEGE